MSEYKTPELPIIPNAILNELSRDFRSLYKSVNTKHSFFSGVSYEIDMYEFARLVGTLDGTVEGLKENDRKLRNVIHRQAEYIRELENRLNSQ